jgi:hypothetical protein
MMKDLWLPEASSTLSRRGKSALGSLDSMANITPGKLIELLAWALRTQHVERTPLASHMAG